MVGCLFGIPNVSNEDERILGFLLRVRLDPGILDCFDISNKRLLMFAIGAAKPGPYVISSSLGAGFFAQAVKSLNACSSVSPKSFASGINCSAKVKTL